MRTFEQLTDDEQKKAVAHFTGLLLRDIVEGVIRFNDKLNGDDLQAKIDKACEKAESMKTPWFAHEYILEACREEIEGMATIDAQESHYLEIGERMPVRLA